MATTFAQTQQQSQRQQLQSMTKGVPAASALLARRSVNPNLSSSALETLKGATDALIQRTEKNEDVLEMYKAHFVKLNKVAETAQSHARAMTLERNKAQGGAAEASKQRLAIQAQAKVVSAEQIALEGRLQQLVGQLATTEAEISLYKEKTEEKLTVLSAQFTGLNDLKKAVETGRKKIETMKKKAEEDSRHLTERDAKIKALVAEADGWSEKCKEKEAALCTLEAALARALDEVSAKDARVQGLGQRVDDLEVERLALVGALETARAAQASLEEELTGIKEERAELLSAQAEGEKKLEGWAERAKHADDRIATLEKELVASEDSKRFFADRARGDRADTQAMTLALEEQRELRRRAEEAAQEAQEQAALLQAALEEQRARALELDAGAQGLGQERDALSTELRALTAAHAALSLEHQALAAHHAALQGACLRLGEEKEGMRAAVESRAREIEAGGREAMEKLEETKASLAARFASLEHASASLTALNLELEGRVKAAEAGRKKAEKEAAKKDREKEDLGKTLTEKLNEAVARLDAESRQAREAAAARERELSAQLSAAVADLSAVRDALTAAQAEAGDKVPRAALRALETECERLREREAERKEALDKVAQLSSRLLAAEALARTTLARATQAEERLAAATREHQARLAPPLPAPHPDPALKKPSAVAAGPAAAAPSFKPTPPAPAPAPAPSSKRKAAAVQPSRPLEDGVPVGGALRGPGDVDRSADGGDGGGEGEETPLFLGLGGGNGSRLPAPATAAPRPPRPAVIMEDGRGTAVGEEEEEPESRKSKGGTFKRRKHLPSSSLASLPLSGGPSLHLPSKSLGQGGAGTVHAQLQGNGNGYGYQARAAVARAVANARARPAAAGADSPLSPDSEEEDNTPFGRGPQPPRTAPTAPAILRPAAPLGLPPGPHAPDPKQRRTAVGGRAGMPMGGIFGDLMKAL